jgi:hypothetical protein
MVGFARWAAVAPADAPGSRDTVEPGEIYRSFVRAR